MPEEKWYIVYFLDGRVMRMRGPIERLRELPVKKIEPAGRIFDPIPDAIHDMERISKALGQGLVTIRNVLDPFKILRMLGGEKNHPSPKL